MLDRVRFAFTLLCAGALYGCNPYSIVDSPSGDAQVLSKARACFDQADFTCSGKYYGMLSSASSDTSTSERVFETLAQNGATMKVFMSAAVNPSNGGRFISAMAASMSANGTSGQTRRLAILQAYQNWASITDTRLANLVRFIGAASLLAEILSEDSGTSGAFRQTDWVTNVSTCNVNTLVFTGCAAPSGKTIVAGATVTLSSTTTTSAMSGSPTLGMIKGAIVEISNALSNLSVSGGIGSTTSGFATTAIASAYFDPTQDTVFRGLLLDLGIGAP